MNLNLNKYIVPITVWGKCAETDGVGILVGNLFITAGHVVIQNEYTSFRIEKQDFKLTKDQAYLIRVPEKEITSIDFDICIFILEGVESPFVLSEELPMINQHLTSVSYKQRIINDICDVKENAGLFDRIFSQEEKIEMRYSDGTVTEIENNFFLCQMSVPLEPGRSGSPIIQDNKVFGILYGGNEEGNYCFFLSSKSILECLESQLQ